MGTIEMRAISRAVQSQARCAATRQPAALQLRAFASKTPLALIKELRERSGAGIAACKRAIDAADGNLDDAFDELRKEGLAAAAKKAGRVAAEGLIAVARSDDCLAASVIELNSETDFVSRNETFISLAERIAQTAQQMEGVVNGPIDIAALNEAQMSCGSGKVVDVLAEMVGKMGENITLRRGCRLQVEGPGTVACYLHGKAGESSARMVSVLGVSGAASDDVADVSHQIAMHIAAARPQFVSRSVVDSAVLAKEEELLTEQAKQTMPGKPDKVIANVVKGRLNKFYGEVVLEEQEFMMGGDEKISTGKLLKRHGDALGVPLVMTGFECFQCGEGIEKKEDNFAEEVSSMAGQ